VDVDLHINSEALNSSNIDILGIISDVVSVIFVGTTLGLFVVRCEDDALLHPWEDYEIMVGSQPVSTVVINFQAKRLLVGVEVHTILMHFTN
jgi:hypothetical protein